MLEADFQQQILEVATLYRWRSYHTFDSRRSAPGFPDLTLVRPPELIIAEVKGDTTRVTPEQDAWLADLQAVSALIGAGLRQAHFPRLVPRFDVYLWRPADWDRIVTRLQRRHT